VTRWSGEKQGNIMALEKVISVDLVEVIISLLS
jgi:hypothetical protein